MRKKTKKEWAEIAAKRKATREANARKTKRKVTTKKESETNGLTVVGVRFNGTYKTYHYWSDIPFKEGDKAVVDTPSNGLTIVDVVSVSKENASRVLKWIVQKIDLTAYQERVKLAERKRVLELEMDQRIEKLQERDRFKLFAKEDPQLAKMLKEYNSLS